MRKWRCNSGVTLLELLLVVILIGILAAVFIPRMATSTAQAKANVAGANIATISAAIQSGLTSGMSNAEILAAFVLPEHTVALGEYIVYDQDTSWTYSYSYTEVAGPPPATTARLITATKIDPPDEDETLIFDMLTNQYDVAASTYLPLPTGK